MGPVRVFEPSAAGEGAAACGAAACGAAALGAAGLAGGGGATAADGAGAAAGAALGVRGSGPVDDAAGGSGAATAARTETGAAVRSGGAGKGGSCDVRASAGARSASSSWSRSPPGPGCAGSIEASRRAAAARAAGPARREAACRAAPERHHQRCSQPLHGLIGERPQIAAALLEPVQQIDAGNRLAGDHRREERLDRLLVDEAEHLADAVGGERSRNRSREADRAWIRRRACPPAARRAIRSIASGSTDRLVGGEDHLQLARDLRHGHPSEVEALDSRKHGRSDAAAVGRAEDEDRVVGRLLERLEQHVPALGDPLDLVDDEDLPAQVRGSREDTRQELAHVADGVVGCRVELGHVQRAAVADGDARGARVARLAVAQVRAVERLGQDPGERSLARSARTHEQVRMRASAGPDAVPQRLDDGLLPDDLAERLGTPAAVDGLMRSGRAHDVPTGMGESNGRAPCTLHRSIAPEPTTRGGSDQAIPRHPAVIV